MRMRNSVRRPASSRPSNLRTRAVPLFTIRYPLSAIRCPLSASHYPLFFFGTYKSDASGASSDVGSCVIRIGSNEPVLTEETTLPNGYLANPCSSQQLVLLGID